MYYSTKIFAGRRRRQERGVHLLGLGWADQSVVHVRRDRLGGQGGRRPLLLIGTAVQSRRPGDWSAGCFTRKQHGTGLLVCVILFIAAFAMAMGPIGWLFCSEIFPNKVRGRAMSLAALTVWVSCYMVAQTFPMLNDSPAIGPAKTFWTYAAVSLLSFFFVLALIPETKGRTLEQIETMWKRPAKTPEPTHSRMTILACDIGGTRIKMGPGQKRRSRGAGRHPAHSGESLGKRLPQVAIALRLLCRNNG